jgi:methionyl-tRNA formyltransferase
MQMDQGLDTGDILATLPVDIMPETTGGELLEVLAQAGRRIVRENLLPLEKLAEKAHQQPEEGATYAHKFTSREAQLDWNQTSVVLDRVVRAFDPAPGAWFYLEGKRMKVFKAAFLPSSTIKAPGTILDARFTVSCGEGSLHLLEIQPEGKNRMKGEDFLRSRSHLIGKSL